MSKIHLFISKGTDHVESSSVSHKKTIVSSDTLFLRSIDIQIQGTLFGFTPYMYLASQPA